MALTKSAAAVDACQEIAQNTILEGTTVDLSGAYEAMLHIDFALCNATPHTGTKIIIQVSGAASGDDNWEVFREFVSITGTTDLEVITNNPAAIGTTVLTCASTTGYATGQWIFLEDVTTFANSEWCYIVAVSANTSVTIMDGTTRAHNKNSIMNSIAQTYVMALPLGILRVRIVYDNTYDSDGATVAIRSNIVKVTAV